MDPRTIAALLLISGVECSLLFLVAGLERRRGSPPFSVRHIRPALFWGSGTLANFFGILGLMMQGKIPLMFSIVMPNVLLIVGQILILAGLRRLTGARSAWRRYLIGLLLYFAVVMYFTIVKTSIQGRIIFFSLAMTAFYVEGACLAMINRPSPGGGFHAFLAGVFGMLALFYLGRTAIVIIQPVDSIFTPGFMNLATYIVSHVGLIGWSLGLILMEQRLTEIALEAAAASKAVLLRELQHRIKNSLSVVASLISLEASRSDDQAASSVLDGLYNRVSALATLYDQLLDREGSDLVELDRYLTSVVEALFKGQAALERGIALKLDLASLRISARQAVPLGLIVNELVSDCLKHGFPGGRSGTVAVSLSPVESQAILRVCDDGEGLPAGFDPDQSSGMGLPLVKLLAEQINGTFSSASESGAVFTIRFPIESP